MSIGGQVNIYNSPGEKSKTTSEKKLSAVVRDYKQFLSETENTTLRTKLDQLQIGDNKYFLERKFSSIFSIAANITMNWAESEEDNSYYGIIYLSSLNTTKSSSLHKLVWGEFASRIGDESKKIYRELLEMKEKILVIIDGLGNEV